MSEFKKISANCCREDIQLTELIAREEEVQVLGGVRSSIWLESAGQKRTCIQHSAPHTYAGAPECTHSTHTAIVQRYSIL
jgi:hypothetical protein